jgi:adenylate cyclase
MNQGDFKRRLTVILSADVEEYSRLMEEDEESTVRSLKACRELMSAIIERYNGRVVGSPGKNLLAEFDSVRDAVRSAVEIQEELKIRNDDLPENRRMQFRLGINLGDIVEDGDRIYGDGINVAAHVESLAKGGGICISGTVYDSIKNKISMGYEFMGEHNVENIKEPVRIYRVTTESVTPAAAVEEKKTGSGVWQKAALAVAVIIILGSAVVWYYSSRRASVDVDEVVEPKSIAVLPFENMSSDPEQKYFAEGLSEELLNMLAQIRGLNVTGRTSSFAFKDSKKTAQEIAEILGVDNVLEGSVRKEKTKLRITAQLLRASDGFHLWSKTYDRELKDIFEVQEDIAKTVAEELKAKLGIRSLKQSGGTHNAAAHELYLIGQGEFNDGKYTQAMGSIEAALMLDPEFALAHAYKATIHNALAYVGAKNRVAEEREAALQASQKAIELGPEVAETHFYFGQTKTLRGDWIEAEQAYKKALELVTDPSLRHKVEFPVQYECVRHLEKAREILEAYLENDPLNELLMIHYNMVLSFLGDLQRFKEINEQAKELFKDKGDWRVDLRLFQFNLQSGNSMPREEIPKEIAAEFTAMGIDLESPEKSLAIIQKYFTDLGDRIPNQGLISFAIYAAYLGNPELAMELIEKVSIPIPEAVYNLWYPVMKDVRQTPRFKKYIRKAGLIDYWKEYGWPDLCRPLDGDDFECD